MMELILEMVVWLLLAALVGVVIGWFLRVLWVEKRGRLHQKDLRRLVGMKRAYYERLVAAGVCCQEVLRQRGRCALGRKTLAKATEIPEQQLLRLLNQADLMRIPGMNELMADLLEEAGVDTVVELSQRVPDKLHQKLQEVQTHRAKAVPMPQLEEVGGWIDSAKALPRLLTY